MINFDRYDFFPKRNNLNVEKVLSLLSKYIIHQTFSKNFDIEDISSLKILKQNSILFLDRINKTNEINFKDILIVTNEKKNIDLYKNVILTNNFNESYNQIINELYFHEDLIDFKDDLDLNNGSYISKFSSIDESVNIGKNCFIGRGVKIGKNCIIKNNVVIKNSIIRDNVIIGDNTTIGSSGFGFPFNNRGVKNLNPHIGIVFINNNCRIGSNCTIDRGKIDYTYLGKNCMLDNLIHLGHNVEIGDNACVAAQSGVSGSTIIGNNFTSGGQSGFAGHIKLGNNVIVAAKSGVTKNIKDNSTVAGFPASDIKEWKRSIIKLKNV